MTRHILCAPLATFAILTVTMMPATAEQPDTRAISPPTASAALQFRRVYVPDDLIDTWPRHGLRYVPMNAADFEQAAARLQSLKPQSPKASLSAVSRLLNGSSGPPKAELVRGTYEARLVGDALTNGTAAIEIHQLGSAPALLPLDPCRLPIQSPMWFASEQSGSASPRGSEASARASAAPAMLGVGANGKLELRVDHSGTLRFDWSLVGRRETGSAISFDLQLPPAPSNRLRLALPADLIPSVDQGFISREDENRDNQSPAVVQSDAKATAAKSGAERHWIIELEGQSKSVLRVARSDFFRENRPLTLVRESLTYEFSPRGLQLSADLKLDVLGEPIRRIALEVDPPLDLVTARFGGVQVPWYEAGAESKSGGSGSTWAHDSQQAASIHAATDQPSPRRIVIELPEPLRGTGRIVRLGFTAPPMSRGRLPVVRPNADGLYWQEGNASLSVPLPLEISELTLAGCRQTKAEPLPKPTGGESISLQYFRPDADVTVAIGHRSERPTVRSGTKIEVLGNTISARYRADVSVQDGECFNLSGDVSPDWIIDGVETVPAGSLSDWSVASAIDSPPRLQIVLAKPIRAEQPVELIVTGRWRRSLGQPLRANDLGLVALRDVSFTRRLTSIRVTGPYRMQISGADDLHRIDPARLSAADSAVLGGASGNESLVFVNDDAATQNLAIHFGNAAPQFSGTVRLDACVADNVLVESYRIRCRTESGELDHLLVQFSQRRDEPPRWNWLPMTGSESEGSSFGDAFGPAAIHASPISSATAGGQPSGVSDFDDEMTSRRLSPTEQAALGLANSGEIWELTFRKPANKPFELQAVRTTPLRIDTPLSLAALVKADEQRGAVSIWSTGRQLPAINNRRLTPIPIDRIASGLQSAGNVLPASSSATELFPLASDTPASQAANPSRANSIKLAAYEYSPAEELASAALPTAPSLTISPGTVRPAAWSWSCRLDSYYAADGLSENTACWLIENTSRTQVRIQPPAGAKVHAAWIDGNWEALRQAPSETNSKAPGRADSRTSAMAVAGRAAEAASTGANQPIVLELPPGRRFVNLKLQWSSGEGALALVSSRASQLPEIDMAIFSRRWHVWLPPRFGLSNSELDARSSLVSPLNWSQRLFGPLGKPAGHPVFNPIDVQRMIAAAGTAVDRDEAWNQSEELAGRITRRVRAAAAAKAQYDAKIASARRSAALGTSARSGANVDASRLKAPPIPTSPHVPLEPDVEVTPFATLTWGNLLSDAKTNGKAPVRRSGASLLPLLIDARAMADIGLLPRSPVPLVSSEADSGSALSRADLVLLVDSRAIVLTCRSAASNWRVPWTTSQSIIERAPTGPFDNLLTAALAGSAERFVPVDFWSFPVEADDLPLGSTVGTSSAVDHAGWSVYDLSLTDAPRRISIVDRDTMLAASCCIFLLTILLVFAKGDVSLKQQGIVMSAATAIALLLPASYVPLGAGLWLGFAGGWTLRYLARWDRPLGAYSSRLLAAASRIGATTPNSEIVPTYGPVGESGDSTLPAGPSVLPSNSRGSSIRMPNGPSKPLLGLLLAVGCLLWHEVRAAEPAVENQPVENAKTNFATNHEVPAGPDALAKASAVESDSSNGPIYDVLIPRGEQERPKENVYLVPEPLYRELTRFPGNDARPTENWLLTSAMYRGGIVRSAPSGSLETADWSAEFDLEVFSLPAHVRIPLDGPGTNLLPDGLRIDGQPAIFQWESNPDGVVSGDSDAARRGVGFEIAAIGHHKISLAFRPMANDQPDATAIDFSIPRLATSRLELMKPTGVPIDLPNALGAPVIQRTKNKLVESITQSLGPTDRISVRAWHESRTDAALPPVVDVDELYWLKVRPGSVTLEARFNVRVADGRLTQLRLLEDPRLRRLPLDSDSPISEVRTEEGELHTMYVGMAHPVVDRTSFKLSFLLTDTSGIGNLRLPRLEVIGARFTDRRLAVSVESPLEFDDPTIARASGVAPAAPLAPAQFLAAWGTAEAMPQLAYTLAAGDTSWTLPIHPRQARVESSEQAVIALARSRLHETWLADLTVLDGTVFQIKLAAPPDWNVEEATLRQEGSPDEPVRWARAPDGSLTLFLPGAAPDNSQLLVRGSAPLSILPAALHGPGATMPLPDLRIAGPSLARVVSRTALLLRGDNVQVSVADPAAMKHTSKAAMQAAVRRALDDGLLEQASLAHLRPIAFLAGRGATAGSPAVRISANAPQIEVKELTTLERSDAPTGGWSAAVDLDLTIAGGVLDGLRFDVSPQWTDITVTPAMPTQLVDIPGENRRQLVVRPAEPWTGKVRLQLTGTIVTPLGERVRVPDVRPLGIAGLHRYILLPARAGDQNLYWEASGVVWQQLPKRFTPGSTPLDVDRTCEVVDEHFDVSLKSVEKTIGEPRLHLADISVTCGDQGKCYGIASFDLEPSGSSNCMLELAPNEQLINVRADGTAVPPRLLGARHWSVALGDSRLPQRVEVVFTADLSDVRDGGDGLPLAPPSLVGLIPEQSIWSVAAQNLSTGIGDAAATARHSAVAPAANSTITRTTSEKMAPPVIVVSGGASLSPVDRDRIRLQAISQMLQAAGAARPAETDEQLDHWFGLWTERLRMVSANLNRLRSAFGDNQSARVAVQEARTIGEREIKLAGQMGIEESTNGQSALLTTWNDASGFSAWRGDDGQFAIGYSGPSIALTLPDRGLPEPLWRMLMVIIGTGAVGLLFWFGSRPGRFSTALGFPGVVGIAVGFFWWLAMQPSWLGLAILVAGTIIAFRGWRVSRQSDANGAVVAG